MTVYRAHQIVPTLLGDGPWADELSLLDLPVQPSGPWSQPGDRVGCRHLEFARCVLSFEPSAVKAARQFTLATLGSYGADDLFDDASIVISELVTNAVRYGQCPGLACPAPARIEVLLLREASHLLCVVTDSNPGPPVLLELDFTAVTGRGLHVIEALSTRWGWAPLATGGKAVWAALPISRSAGISPAGGGRHHC